ncbi:MAG: class I SAM-dependent methyltransferase family protein [Theionarchaea archaeon]|nr:class I SAM-dependent methyltransferase family protein [Theionarchaea archaeon]MBU7022210.1 class I SAM-dependent methyltransferase family protein [Theionarchaea archaeon]MBU7036191.1 class I SAM-dependent methyltransferase family protein [Theionarchaea archaeon]
MISAYHNLFVCSVLTYLMEPETRKRIRDSLGSLPVTIREDLPESFEKIGDILIIYLKPHHLPFEAEIGEAYRRAFDVKTVLRKGRIHGNYRVPDSMVIAGSETVTTHKENSILYQLDLSQVMFCSGNIHERIRVSTFPPHEKVVDMFAGIGYFTLPIAKYCHSHVQALEKNEHAYRFLCENIVQNNVAHLVTPHLMDCSEYEGLADRVIMGHPRAHAYLEKAFALVDRGVLVYHEFAPEGRSNRAIERLTSAARKAGKEVSIEGMRRIKKYSPGVWHIVCDARIQ